MKDKIFICSYNDLMAKKYIVKWIDSWSDELIVFLDTESNKIKIKSSICPHFGGQIIYDESINQLKCLWHDWRFCKNTGECLTYPIKGKLSPYDFEVNPNPLKTYDTLNKNQKIYAIKK